MFLESRAVSCSRYLIRVKQRLLCASEALYQFFGADFSDGSRAALGYRIGQLVRISCARNVIDAIAHEGHDIDYSFWRDTH